ncbi:MAG: DUF6062 family protein [Alkalispirochaetaceae bacterium]
MADEGKGYYLRVLETLPGAECPACREVQGSLDEYLRRTLYGRITDRRFRAAFDAAGGFCRDHARRLAAFSDGLAISLLYETPLREAMEQEGLLTRLQQRLAAVRPGGRRFRGFKVSGNCPACDRESEAEGHYLSIIARHWEKEELRAAFEQSGGLCLPHYRRLVRKRRPPAWLERFQRKKAEELSADIARFVAYANATTGARPELSREEQLRWKEVLRFLYGERVLPEAESPPNRDAW